MILLVILLCAVSSNTISQGWSLQPVEFDRNDSLRLVGLGHEKITISAHSLSEIVGSEAS